MRRSSRVMRARAADPQTPAASGSAADSQGVAGSHGRVRSRGPQVPGTPGGAGNLGRTAAQPQAGGASADGRRALGIRDAHLGTVDERAAAAPRHLRQEL